METQKTLKGERITTLALSEKNFKKLKMYCLNNNLTMKTVLSEKIEKIIEDLKNE